jgi:hypothetical protein
VGTGGQAETCAGFVGGDGDVEFVGECGLQNYGRGFAGLLGMCGGVWKEWAMGRANVWGHGLRGKKGG